MKRLSLKKIALIFLLIPFFALADNSWNHTTDDEKTYYAGADNKAETLAASCNSFCGAFYKIKGKISVNKDNTETSCVCATKGTAVLKNNE